MGSHLILIDGNAMVYRAHFALHKYDLRADDGMPGWAVYGFWHCLAELAQYLKPTHMAVGFDTGHPTFRHQAYPRYKAERETMPDALSLQFPIIRHLVSALGMPSYEVDGYEADDVLGTVARLAAERLMHVTLVTTDQDAMQLVGPNITVLTPKHGGGEMLLYGPAEVERRYGVTPEQFVCYKALCGDDSDNLPGVPGIGPKKASALLRQFGSAINAADNLGEVKATSQREALLAHRGDMILSHSLARINTDVPMDFDPAVQALIKSWPLDRGLVERIFRRLGFNSAVEHLDQTLSHFGR